MGEYTCHVQAGVEFTRGGFGMGEMAVRAGAVCAVAAKGHIGTKNTGKQRLRPEKSTGSSTYCLKGQTGFVQFGKNLQSAWILGGRGGLGAPEAGDGCDPIHYIPPNQVSSSIQQILRGETSYLAILAI